MAARCAEVQASDDARWHVSNMAHVERRHALSESASIIKSSAHLSNAGRTQSSLHFMNVRHSKNSENSCTLGQVSDPLQVQSWQVQNHKSAVEQMLVQQWLVVALPNGRSMLHVSEPSLLCAVPFLVCLLLRRGLMSHPPACDLKL